MAMIWKRRALSNTQEVYTQQGGAGKETDLIYLEGFLKAVDYRDIIVEPVVVYHLHKKLVPNFN